MEIAIVGCGIGGLAMASLLAKSGHSVVVFDKFERPEPVGSGLVIQMVALPVLELIGAKDAVLRQGTPTYHMLGLEVDTGQKILDVRYGPEGGGAFGLGIHRAALFACLLASAQHQNITFCHACEVVATCLTGNKRQIFDLDGQSLGGFDLVIDASGAGSKLSPLISKQLTFGAVWGTVNWPLDTHLSYSRLEQRYRKASNMIGVLPIGHIPEDPHPKAAFFWSLPQAAYAQWRETPFDQWQEQAIALWPDLDLFVRQLTAHNDLTMARYGHGTLRRPIGERIAYIGDAAHRASPQLGQGANMALLDAYALTEALDSNDVGGALPSYAMARRRHVALYQAMSWAFTPMYQSNSRVLPALRDWILAPLSHVAPMPAILTSLVKGTLVSPTAGYYD